MFFAWISAGGAVLNKSLLNKGHLRERSTSFITNKLTNYMEQSPSCEANRSSASQVPYILESNPHPVFCDFLNEKKKLVRDSNPHLSFNHPLPTGRLIE
jgi:hypothetical protein